MAAISQYAEYTPAEIFDLRCEYEVPRYFDLCLIDEETGDEIAQEVTHYEKGGLDQETQFFNWFLISHDFKVTRKFVKVDKKQL